MNYCTGMINELHAELSIALEGKRSLQEQTEAVSQEQFHLLLSLEQEMTSLRNHDKDLDKSRPQGNHATDARVTQLEVLLGVLDSDGSGSIDSNKLLQLGHFVHKLELRIGALQSANWDEKKNAQLIKEMISQDGRISSLEFLNYLDTVLPNNMNEFDTVIHQLLEVASTLCETSQQANRDELNDLDKRTVEASAAMNGDLEHTAGSNLKLPCVDYHTTADMLQEIMALQAKVAWFAKRERELMADAVQLQQRHELELVQLSAASDEELILHLSGSGSEG